MCHYGNDFSERQVKRKVASTTKLFRVAYVSRHGISSFDLNFLRETEFEPFDLLLFNL